MNQVFWSSRHTPCEVCLLDRFSDCGEHQKNINRLHLRPVLYCHIRESVCQRQATADQKRLYVTMLEEMELLEGRAS